MTKEIEAFLRKARRALQAGELMLSEAFPEDAASDAYYAMLYAAKAMLLGAGQRPTRHKQVARKFQDLYVTTGRVDLKFLRSLEDGYKTRHFADYETELTYAITAQAAQASLKEAAEFLAKAEEILRTSGS